MGRRTPRRVLKSETTLSGRIVDIIPLFPFPKTTLSNPVFGSDPPHGSHSTSEHCRDPSTLVAAIPDASPRAAPAAVALFAETEPDIDWTPLLSPQFVDLDFLSEQIAIVRDIAKQSKQI
jgi:hypothetical protein